MVRKEIMQRFGWWLLPWVFVLLILLATFYSIGFYLAKNSDSALSQREVFLKEQLQGAKLREQTLQRELAELKVGSQVDRKAIEKINEQIFALETQVSDQKDEIAFYREYINPKQKRAKAKVRSFRLQKVEDKDQLVSFKLVLEKNDIDSKETETGLKTKLEIKGDDLKNKRQTVFSWDQLSSDVFQANMDVKFKYFKILRGNLKVPENFEPKLIKISLQVGSSRPIVREFPWKIKS